jgi:integrase
VSELEPVEPQSIVVPPGTSVVHTDADYAITDETARRLADSTPANTQKAYDRAWKNFCDWCTTQSRNPLPATAQTLTEYVRHLIDRQLAPATIDQAMGVIRAKHAQDGYDDQPPTKPARKIYKAYRREWTENGHRVRKAPPVVIDALRAMVDTCDPDTLAGIRDRALLLLGFNMMARRSELAALDIGDLRESSEGLTVYIRSSKTDQAAEGVEVNVPYGQHAETCAVRSVRAWKEALAEHGITNGALFRPIDRHGRLPHEAKAAGRTSTRLTGKSVAEVIRRRGKLAGLEGNFTGHSLRAGAATAAYAANNPVSAIAEQGRWSPKSPVVLGYIRSVDKWKNNPMKGIGL